MEEVLNEEEAQTEVEEITLENLNDSEDCIVTNIAEAENGD